jgi:hypothetical protein
MTTKEETEMAVAATLLGGVLGTIAFFIALLSGSGILSAIGLYALTAVTTLIVLCLMGGIRYLANRDADPLSSSTVA